MSNHIKLYSGTSILVNRLAYILDEIGISSIIKDNKESSRLAGFGPLGQSVDLLINEEDYEKAKDSLDIFQKEISK
ncbi:putative signal transducing protein [Tenacibaculum sp. MEBiC06402]|uniref:putative signal transducing protein n=1 Tax=unclassified Tenacibaculum TaxID=2635139 RepID=UPI003B9CAFA8